MKKQLLVIGCALFSLSTFAEVSTFAKDELAKVVPNTITRQANNGWLYSKNEFQHLAKGDLINGEVIKVSTCAKKIHADPAAALVDFNSQLNNLGIKLILVPVPPKVAFYPMGRLQRGEAMTYLIPYYKELRTKGLNVLDLSKIFLEHQAENVYCKTDAHWSPTGITWAAVEVAKQIKERGETHFASTPMKAIINGDLAKSLNAKSPESESVTLNQVKGETLAESSPILVIGDSHTLVFSTGGDMLAQKAGFCEALAQQLKMPVERIGVKGAAATAVRINLYRKAVKNPDWLKNKKYVIYVFSCREFTEAGSGWIKVPIQK